MGPVYRYKNASGQVVYTDQLPPADAQEVQTRANDGSYKEAKRAIKEVQKRVPKAFEYLQVLEHLRSHDSRSFSRYMTHLKVTNPKLWIELQKNPSFRPFTESKAFERNIGLALSASKSYDDPLSFAGALVDRAAPRLLDEAKHVGTIPSVKTSAIAASRIELLKAGGSAVGRVGGVFLDAELQLLDPNNAKNIWTIKESLKLRKLSDKGVIPMDGQEFSDVYRLISDGRLGDADKLMDELKSKYEQGVR